MAEMVRVEEAYIERKLRMLMMIGSAVVARHDVERDRAEERATGSTTELRKVVAGLLVKAARRVNAVYEINPENEKAAKAIGDVAAIVEHYKRVAAEFKGKKKADPEPESAPEATTIS